MCFVSWCVEDGWIQAESCHSLVSCLHVRTCIKLLMHMCLQVSMHARPDQHPHTYTHAHSCRLPHPVEPDLCLAPVLHPPLSLLISGMAEEVLQETTATALCSDLACMSGLFPAAAWPQDATQSKKKESRGSWLPSAPGSGLCPQWLRKKSSRGV